MGETRLARHDLVWLTSVGMRRARWIPSCRPEAGFEAADEARALLADWVTAARPLIVTRQGANAEPGWLRLGLALPPALGKRRVAFLAPLNDVARSAPPPALETAGGILPAGWRKATRSLLEIPEITAAAPRVYGSAAMQLVTGLPCLTAGSDLDLLLTPPDWDAALAATRALARLAGAVCTPRIDGEIRNASGDAVAWRELAGASSRLLIKGCYDVRLTARGRFAASFAAVEAAA